MEQIPSEKLTIRQLVKKFPAFKKKTPEGLLLHSKEPATCRLSKTTQVTSSSRNCADKCGHTDVHDEIIDSFRDYAKAPKNAECSVYFSGKSWFSVHILFSH